ncbi:hypothetical protein BD770DRAFT_329768, partial [Pilaira anomala]
GFDWDDLSSEEDTDEQHVYGNRRHCFLCLSSASSKLSWICFLILTAISVAVCVAVFVTVKPQQDPTMVSYNLALWFTFVAFMFCITLVVQMIVEVIPWVIRKIATLLVPKRSEIVRYNLAYYLDLRPYTKLVVIGAWAWGAWTFLRIEVDLPEGVGLPKYVQVLETVWEIIFLFTLFIFLEKLILQFIVTSFHKKAYEDRLAVNRRALRVLEKLKRAKKDHLQQDLFKWIRLKKAKNAPTNKNDNNVQGKSIIHTHRPEQDEQQDNEHQAVRFPSNHHISTLISIPPVNSKEKHKKNSKNYFKKIATKLATNKVNTIHEKTQEGEEEEDEEEDQPRLKRSETPLSSISDNSNETNWWVAASYLYSGYMKLSKESAFQDAIHQAKKLARRIYFNIMGPSPTRSYLIESDFYPYFLTLSDAKEAFKLFDSDQDGHVSPRELRAGCIRTYRDRRNLARSMRDMSQATGKLDLLLLIIFVCIWIIVSLAIFGINVSTQLTPLWSAFIAASFIFGNSAKDTFECILFVFVTHPFDSGDRVLIETNNWVVVSVGITVSTFKNLDGSVLYAKNSVLATKYIINCRRTVRASETFEIQVSFHTPSWKLQELRDHMVEWNNKYPKLYTKNACGSNIIKFENLNRITMTFFFEHSKNWQDARGRWLRHNNFLLELKDEMHRLGITYKRPEQPVLVKYYGDEEREEDEEEDRKGKDIPEFKGWLNTSVIQNQAGIPTRISGSNTHSNGDDNVNDGEDAGARMGAAAAVAYTTGAF